MKRFLNVMRVTVRTLASVVITGIVFSACKKNDPEFITTPAAGLMAFNLAPDKSAIGFTLSGNQFGGQPLGYSNFTGTYLPVFVGNREVRSFDYNTGSTLAISNGSFADSTYYSLFLLGANGMYRNLLVKDELDTLAAVGGKAWVRFINAIPDSSAPVLVTIGESTISESAPYATVSSFKQVNAGSVNTSISNGGNILTTRTITLEANKIYTVLFSGLPGQADPSKTVQTRFIQNGTITP
jgi:hypothetical protein